MSSSTQLDANQVIKKVYDDTTASLNVVQNYVDVVTLVDAASAALSATTSAVYIMPYHVVGVMANWASLNHTDPTLQFQGSLDQSVWDNIGAATTLSSASGHQSYSLVDEPYAYFRLVYVHGTNTTGTLTIKYVLRG